VDDAGAVSGLERRADLPGDGQCLVELQASGGEPAGEGLALEVLEDDVGLTGGEGVEVEHLDDVGVPEPGGDLRLTPETLQHLLAAARRVEQHLHRDVLAGQSQVLRCPHRAHAAATDETLDAIGLAQHGTHVEHVAASVHRQGWTILGCRP
jgi:hypothetical protein